MTLAVTRSTHNGSYPVNEQRLCLHRSAWLPGALGPTPVDAFEQHRQLCRTEQHAAGVGQRPHEATSLQTLAQQAHAVPVAPQELHQIASAAAEREDVSGVRIFS